MFNLLKRPPKSTKKCQVFHLFLTERCQNEVSCWSFHSCHTVFRLYWCWIKTTEKVPQFRSFLLSMWALILWSCTILVYDYLSNTIYEIYQLLPSCFDEAFQQTFIWGTVVLTLYTGVRQTDSKTLRVHGQQDKQLHPETEQRTCTVLWCRWIIFSTYIIGIKGNIKQWQHVSLQNICLWY